MISCCWPISLPREVVTPDAPPTVPAKSPADFDVIFFRDPPAISRSPTKTCRTGVSGERIGATERRWWPMKWEMEPVRRDARPFRGRIVRPPMFVARQRAMSARLAKSIEWRARACNGDDQASGGSCGSRVFHPSGLRQAAGSGASWFRTTLDLTLGLEAKMAPHREIPS